MHVFGLRQSAADWQGNAHLPYCRLQWCVPQGTSSWHWNAMGPGTAICPEPVGAGVGRRQSPSARASPGGAP